jgi:hypothetical protein
MPLRTPYVGYTGTVSTISPPTAPAIAPTKHGVRSHAPLPPSPLSSSYSHVTRLDSTRGFASLQTRVAMVGRGLPKKDRAIGDWLTWRSSSTTRTSWRRRSRLRGGAGGGAHYCEEELILRPLDGPRAGVGAQGGSRVGVAGLPACVGRADPR